MLFAGSEAIRISSVTNDDKDIIEELNDGLSNEENLIKHRKGVASLSPYIALLVTKDRAVGFDATSNRFIETKLPIHDELITAKAEKYVAVVITSSREHLLSKT